MRSQFSPCNELRLKLYQYWYRKQFSSFPMEAQSEKQRKLLRSHQQRKRSVILQFTSFSWNNKLIFRHKCKPFWPLTIALKTLFAQYWGGPNSFENAFLAVNMPFRPFFSEIQVHFFLLEGMAMFTFSDMHFEILFFFLKQDLINLDWDFSFFLTRISLQNGLKLGSHQLNIFLIWW